MGVCCTSTTSLDDVTQLNNEDSHRQLLHISNKSESDLNVFKSQKYNKNNNNKCENVEDCISIKRLLGGLSNYSSLNVMHDADEQEMFNRFINETYTQFLNDYVHLIRGHSNSKDLAEINDGLNECNMNDCKFTLRHLRGNDINNADEYDDKLDPALNFYISYMDSIHYLLYHIFDAGLRVKILEEMHDVDEDEKYFDDGFNRINNMISKRKKNGKIFDRFKNNKNKYTINMHKNVNTIHYGLGDENTCLEEIYDALQKVNVSSNDIYQFFYFLNEEEFESDAIIDDIEEYGNISSNISNIKIMDCIKNIIKTAQASVITGYRFYYWSYYRSRKQIPHNEVHPNNIHPHNGYNICDLFIKARYSSFKEEILTYKHISYKQYKEEVLMKAQMFHDTDIVKATKSIDPEKDGIFLHYDIARKTPLGINNLMSLILYTDFSDLNSDFLSSFRQIGAFEALKSVKNRNKYYYWMSKILRETVELYGQCRSKSRHNPGLFGSCYCAVSYEMNMSSFDMRLNAPTSASIHIEVAINFSGSGGIIMRFNNNSLGDNDTLRGFDCSWLSKYNDESERLFCGGYYPIKMESIILRRTRQNFQKFICSMWYLDRIICGAGFYPHKDVVVSDDDILILKGLINDVLGKPIKMDTDPYIESTFHCFVQQKQQLIVDLHELHEYADNKMVELVMNPLDKRNYDEESPRDGGDLSNLFVSEIFGIFSSVKTVIIKTTDDWGKYSYSFCLWLLLRLTSSTSVQKVVVKAVKCNDNDTWIGLLRSKSSSIIKIKQITNIYGDKEDQLIIHKKK